MFQKNKIWGLVSLYQKLKPFKSCKILNVLTKYYYFYHDIKKEVLLQNI